MRKKKKTFSSLRLAHDLYEQPHFLEVEIDTEIDAGLF